MQTNLASLNSSSLCELRSSVDHEHPDACCDRSHSDPLGDPSRANFGRHRFAVKVHTGRTCEQSRASRTI